MNKKEGRKEKAINVHFNMPESRSGKMLSEVCLPRPTSLSSCSFLLLSPVFCSPPFSNLLPPPACMPPMARCAKAGQKNHGYVSTVLIDECSILELVILKIW